MNYTPIRRTRVTPLEWEANFILTHSLDSPKKKQVLLVKFISFTL